MKAYELFIGFRYLKSKKSQGIISSNTLLSMVIVFLGVFILIVVLSVMNGFQSAIKDKILDIDSHVTITAVYGSGEGMTIRNYRPVIEKVRTIPEVLAVEGFIQSQGLFRFRDAIAPVMIRGTGKDKLLPNDVKKFIVEGSRDYSDPAGVFVGQEMAINHQIRLGDYIELIVPKGRLTATTGIQPGIESFRVVGLFKTGYYDFDTKLVVMSLPQAQRLFEVGDVVWGIGIKIRDVYRMDQVASLVRSTVGVEYATQTAEERNRNLFYALKLEKLIMMIILFLVIISAGFTIMGTLVMVVMEKRKAVGVLKSMGARPNSIMVIFIMEGFLIGIIGATTGALFGVAASLNLDRIIRWIEWLLNAVHFRFYETFGAILNLGFPERIVIVPTNVYYIEGLPTQVNPEMVVFIAIVAVFLCTVAAIFPAWNASRLRPVETIRYE